MTGVAVAAYFVGSYAWFQAGPMSRLPGILDDDWGFTATEVGAFLEALGADGRATYKSFLQWDFLYPLLFVPMTMGLSLQAWRKWNNLRPYGAVVFLPLVAVVLDWLENAVLLSLLSNYPNIASGAVALASGVSVAKLVVVSVCFALAALIAFALVVHAMMHPVKRGTAAKRAQNRQARRR